MKLHFYIVTVVCLVDFTVALTDADWRTFKQKFQKNYTLTKEETHRRRIFRENYKKIVAHNEKAAKGGTTFRLAPNHLTDKTPQEYKALLGAKVPRVVFEQRMLSLRQASSNLATTTTKPNLNNLTGPTKDITTKPIPITTKHTTTTSTTKPTTTKPKVLPTKVDYRRSVCTAPVRDQGDCGSCWSFSATYETEYYNCKNKGNLTLLSEQNLVDCDTQNSGCDGGWYDYAWQYTIDAEGQCSALAYKSTAIKGTCKRSLCKPKGTLTKYEYIPNKAKSIMEAVANIGPVSVALDASLDTFAYYSKGIYADPKCTKDVNHAVNIVGYGTASGIPYWIIRNSWGSEWGFGGYGFIQRGVNMCGIEDWAAYPVH